MFIIYDHVMLLLIDTEMLCQPSMLSDYISVVNRYDITLFKSQLFVNFIFGQLSNSVKSRYYIQVFKQNLVRFVLFTFVAYSV